MKEKTTKLFDQVVKEEEIFLNYLRSRFPFFHNSNFFYRDMEYGIKSFFEKKNIRMSTSENIEVANRVAVHFEEKGYLRKISDDAWKVNMPQFVTTRPGDPF
jgi:hypothetical protein